jgi:hypothetical protein
MMHGRPIRAVRANTAGAMLCVAVLVAAPYLFVSAARGQWIVRPPGELSLAVGATVFVAVALLDWLIRLWFA